MFIEQESKMAQSLICTNIGSPMDELYTDWLKRHDSKR